MGKDEFRKRNKGEGTLKVSDNMLFANLFRQVMDGKVLLCQQDKELTMFGPGAQSLFDTLATYSK